MKRSVISLAILGLISLGLTRFVSAESDSKPDSYEHGKEEAHKHEDGHEEEGHDHGKEDEHGHEDEHGLGEEEHEHGKNEHGHEEGGHEEEEASAVGPDKGILEKGKKGFRLSPEAIATFELKTAKFAGLASTPKSAIVKVKDEKFLYRISEGWIKRVDLDDVETGDEIVVSGMGYVRMAEVVAEEGMAHGHSH